MSGKQDYHAFLNYAEDDRWVRVSLCVEPGKFSFVWIKLPAKCGTTVLHMPQKSRWTSWRNWYRASTGKPLLCYKDNFAVDEASECLRIEIGFPFDEPYLIKLEEYSIEEYHRIKSVWESR